MHWRDGGVAADGSAGGRWYLEYAHEKGDRARVLNGFMQTLVSLNKFATQTERFGDDPRWSALGARAREYVRLGALELNAHLDEYDLGGGISRYSLTREGPAPDVYQTYHRQLLRLLQEVDYLPKAWREHFSDMRVAWGGKGGRHADRDVVERARSRGSSCCCSSGSSGGGGSCVARRPPRRPRFARALAARRREVLVVLRA